MYFCMHHIYSNTDTGQLNHTEHIGITYYTDKGEISAWCWGRGGLFSSTRNGRDYKNPGTENRFQTYSTIVVFLETEVCCQIGEPLE